MSIWIPITFVYPRVFTVSEVPMQRWMHDRPINTIVSVCDDERWVDFCYEYLWYCMWYSGTSVMGTLMGLEKSVPISEVPPLARFMIFHETKEGFFYEKCIADTHNLFIDYMQWIKYYHNLHINEDNSLKNGSLSRQSV